MTEGFRTGYSGYWARVHRCEICRNAVAVRDRFRRWTEACVWDWLMGKITYAYGRDVRMIDGTSVRAHHSAATLTNSNIIQA
jgi:transposase